MAVGSAIEWTDATWNPVTGCDRVSAGCDHCYALTLAGRLKAMGQSKYQADGDPRTSGPGFGVTLHPQALGIPRRWRTPRMVFVNSMSDLFHPAVPDEYIARVFAVMSDTPRHTFQVLTKRHGRQRSLLASEAFWIRVAAIAGMAGTWRIEDRCLPNVWLGVSVESQQWADIRVPALLGTPAAVRWISAEPLLGPLPGLDLAGIDWVVTGGESGPRHRPVEADWVRQIRDASLASGTPFFFKQWGGRRPKSAGRELDGRVWDETPALAAGLGSVA